MNNLTKRQYWQIKKFVSLGFLLLDALSESIHKYFEGVFSDRISVNLFF
jgi:hypothetical protein